MWLQHLRHRFNEYPSLVGTASDKECRPVGLRKISSTDGYLGSMRLSEAVFLMILTATSIFLRRSPRVTDRFAGIRLFF